MKLVGHLHEQENTLLKIFIENWPWNLGFANISSSTRAQFSKWGEGRNLQKGEHIQHYFERVLGGALRANSNMIGTSVKKLFLKHLRKSGGAFPLEPPGLGMPFICICD